MFNGVVDLAVVGDGRVFQPLSFLCDFWFCLTALGFHGWCGGRVGNGHCLKLACELDIKFLRSDKLPKVDSNEQDII